MRTSAAAALSVLVLLAAGCGSDEPDEPVVVSPEPSDGASDEAGDASSEPEPSEPAEPEPTETPTGTPDGPDEPDGPDGGGTPRVAGEVTTGLTSPWGLDFLPNGDALVAERDTGAIRLVPGDGGDSQVVGEIPQVDPSSEGGLLGIALHPQYPDEPWLYAYYSTPQDNRLVRMPYEGSELGPQEVLLDGIAVAEIHNGGRIGFGPDGLLYVATGDASDTGTAPDPGSLNGKVLRLTPDGDPAPDNPDDDEIYSLGHRNVQGLAWDDEGNLYASEFGQDTWDELNLIEPGSDYGWPSVEGRGGGDGFTDPLVQWSTEEASPSGIAYAAGSVWMTGLRGERLWRIDVSDTGRVRGEPEAFLVGEYGRLRTVETAPDGSLWLVTSNTDGRAEPSDGDDRILRLVVE